ncbi:MAG: TonB-dependent receptor [Rikenellaceae bacterium]
MNLIRRYFILTLAIVASITLSQAAVIKGIVIDETTGEPLIGATVMIKDSVSGTATGIDGDFTLNVEDGEQIIISYISYLTQELTNINGVGDLKVMLKPDTKQLAAVEVVVKANMETEMNLQNERIASSVAIENIGVREMSLKGLSNAEDGVKKITGISVADQGEVIVRGLGDRYSLTTLNGLPVASPNPDMKLIPLDIIPSSAIKNITVSKVYQVSQFADYAGAMIDIATKDMVADNFFNISAKIGGNTQTTGQSFYTSDRASLFTTPTLASGAFDQSVVTDAQFHSYLMTENPFDTTFDISESSALPELGAQIGFGRKWKIRETNNLDLLLSAGVDNSQQVVTDAYVKTVDTDGVVRSNFNYDSYTTELDISGLASMGYTFGPKKNSLNYTMFYARNAVDNYKLRSGVDKEDNNLVGSNSVLRIYSLLTNQLKADYHFGDKWRVDVIGSYSLSRSDEPDRRQVMYTPQEDGSYKVFVLNAQETLRAFTDLDEDEYTAKATASFDFGEKNILKFGGAYRTKSRDYYSTLFYYDYKATGYTPSIDNIYNADTILGYDKVLDGSLEIDKSQGTESKYFATLDIAAAYAEVDYYFGKLMVNVGARVENSRQWVKSWSVGTLEQFPDITELTGTDIFPAVNLKYDFREGNTLRASASKSVTRPSFIEMAPFEYQESYGTTTITGNADIENGYNYNFDLRYDIYGKKGDMISLGTYYKILDNPIERVQRSSGGDTTYSFENSDKGTAFGVEAEFRKNIIKDLRLGVNASYIYTQVVLEEGSGIFTDAQRQLQGASPYLINADISYTLRPSDRSTLTMTMLYNVQGPRIDAVGVSGLNNAIQEKVQTLNFVCNYAINPRMSLSLKLENLLNSAVVVTQEISDGTEIELSRYKSGVDGSLSFSYKF